MGSTWSYSTGLGKSGSGTFNPQGNPVNNSGSGTDTKYFVMAGGATVTLPTLSASATVSAAPSSASLSYTASITPVLINLSGITKDSTGNNNILIGQGCTAYIVAGPATFSNFNWNISGDTFKSFVMGNTVATTLNPSHPYGRVNYLAASDLTGPDPSWYWKNGADFGEQQFVSCTATASINGTAIGTVTGNTGVNVWLPYHYFGPNARGVSLVGASVPIVSVVGNITWEGGVGTPDLFVAYWGNTGIWQYTQLCDIAVVLKDPFLYYSNTNGSVLDAEFNYSSKETPPSPWAADSTSAIPHEESSGDAPTVALNYYSNDTITGTWDTYMMYQPPGTSVSWVPLHKCKWTLTCVVDLIDGVYTPNPPGTLTISSDAPSSEFPVWEGYFPDASH